MAGYDYEIIYKSGKENKAADALSRLHDKGEEITLMAITFPVANWLNLLQDERKKDQQIQKLIQEIKVVPNSHSKFSWSNDQLRYKGRLWLGDKSELKLKNLQESHGGDDGGHSGVKKDS